MDWFKRYGITGSYSVSILLAWLYILFPDQAGKFLNSFEEPIVLLGAAAFVSLPIGYVLSMFQYWWYYRHRELWLHEKALRIARCRLGGPDRYKSFFKQFGLQELQKERRTIWQRLFGKRPPDKTGEHIREACSALWAKDQSLRSEAYKRFFDISQGYMTKRTDVLVMNRTIMFSTTALFSIAGLLGIILLLQLLWNLGLCGFWGLVCDVEVLKGTVPFIILSVVSLFVRHVTLELEGYLQDQLATIVADEYIQRAMRT